MKRIVTIVALMLSIPLATAAFGADGVKIATVDIQKLLVLSDAGKDVKEQLAAKANKYDADKNSREEDLKKLKGELEKQSGILTDDARKAKEQLFFQKRKEMDRSLKVAEEDFEAMKQELTGRIIEEVVKIIQDYGKKNGYLVIFIKNDSMVYVDEKTDLTDEILKVFNSSRKK